jgi:superoxide dismutase, Fe-Mn family
MDRSNLRDGTAGFNRRLMLKLFGLAGATLFGSSTLLSTKAQAQERISVPELPYAANALEPYISARTVEFHYGRHHAGYASKANALIKDMALPQQSLEDLIRWSAQDPDRQALFNNVAQVWNHTFYWNSMKPGGGGEPSGALLEKINDSFGGLEQFKKSFTATAGGRFGSGYAWLVADGSALNVLSTMNAETPLTMGFVPLLTIDVWEHAYYLDYQNLRGDYITHFLDHLVNWDFAAANLDRA